MTWISLARAVGLIACLAMLDVARAADGPRLTIDYDPPRLAVDAHGVTLARILSEIGARVVFTLVDTAGSPTLLDVSIEKSPVDEVLPRLLRGENHTVVYAAGGGIDSIVLLGGPSTLASDRPLPPARSSATSAVTETPVAATQPTRPDSQVPAPSISSPADTSEATAAADRPEATANTLGDILKNHALSAVPLSQGAPDGAGAAAQPAVNAQPAVAAQPVTPDVLAETTRRAQQDLSALVEGLSAATRSLQNAAPGAGRK